MKLHLSKHRKKLIIAVLTLIFVIPMMAAWLSFTQGFFQIDHKTNQGTLLKPPLAIQTLALKDAGGTTPLLRGKWWLIYLTDNVKDPLSKRNLYYIRQIRQATGKERERIERAVITFNTQEENRLWIEHNFPGTQYFIISSAKYRELELILPKKLALRKGSLYLVDPLGNIILFYAKDAAPKGILKDLNRVLKVSQIG